jgi:endonuclease/exonuclease/phosphatase family metal-dependent hydrolase
MNLFRAFTVAAMIGLLSHTAVSETITLRVLTYNIHHGEGVDGVFDLERIAKVIQSVNPDIVALQEVDRETTRVSGVDQAQVLADLTGMHMAYGKALDYQGGQYGNAVLSKFQISESKVTMLPKSEDREQRVFLQTEIEMIDKTVITFVATHLDNASAVDRMSGVEVMESLLPKFNTPVLFAGDMNAVPDSDVIVRLMKTMTSSILDQPLLTSPSENPQRQIDYIFSYPKSRWKTKHVEVLDEAVASDHRALFAILELSDE